MLAYVATPYSHANAAYRELRAQQAAQAIAELLDLGVYGISPIVHGHEVQKYLRDQNTDFQFWRRYCFTLLAKCEYMIVVQIDGWDSSSGIEAEMQFCYQNNIPVKFYKNGKISDA